MKKELLSLLNEYLLIFPKEEARQSYLKKYLMGHSDEEIIDWNNFDGHIVAGAFIYAKKEKKFLCLYHKDLKMYLYPGGHVDPSDRTILDASKREMMEECGLKDLKQVLLSENKLVPIDIDTHTISYNERLHLPEHIHFEFRYLFLIENMVDIEIETKELENYKWIDMEELENDRNFGAIATKLKTIL